MNGHELLAEWKQRSHRGPLTPRSAELGWLDRDLATYCGAPTAYNLAVVRLAITVWKNSKAVGGRTWQQSVRHDAVVWLTRHLECPMVPPIPGVWGNTQNCYAYAACDMAPGHASAVPGATSNPAAPVLRLGGEAQQQYWVRLVAGVVSDAAAQGRAVTAHPGVAVGAIPVPAGGQYVAAMVADGNGFHFLRRDAVGGVWTHKDGAPADPEGVLYNTTADEYRLITDAVLIDALLQANGFQHPFANMQFVAYFTIQLPGFHVSR